MQAAITMTITKPKTQHIPIELRIPRGTALVALAASSDICTQESNAPIVQIGDNQLSIKAQPVGQVVRFSVCRVSNHNPKIEACHQESSDTYAREYVARAITFRSSALA